jgi:UDP-3-O-[3-hydroxymyristoyl] N-acetylglucosamine deacetylase
VEHLLSALAGTGVTDLLVEVDGPELPIGDGSALVWTDAIGRAGLTEIRNEAVRPLVLSEPLIVYGGQGAFVAAYPSDALRLTVATQFDHPLAGTQVARWERRVTTMPSTSPRRARSALTSRSRRCGRPGWRAAARWTTLW